MVNLSLPQELLPDIVGLLAKKYTEAVLDKKRAESATEDLKFKVETLTNRNKELSANAAELARQLSAKDNF